jgi:hypothetical protein
VEFSKYKTEWLLLCGALVIAIGSILADLYSEKDTTWFARSGAILVLFSAIVEYRLSSFLFDDIHKAAVKNAIKNAAISTFEDNKLLYALTAIKPKPPKSRATLAITSHIFIIIGTFIWGYGDFIVK